MKVIILGVGRTGQSAIYAAAKLGYDVLAFDEPGQEESLIDFRKKVVEILGPKKWTYSFATGLNPCIWLEDQLKRNKDIAFVFSCFPYYLNVDIAKICIESKVLYCDLGGHVQTSQAIWKYAEESKKGSVFTDLGLAPGFVNMLALMHYHSISKPEDPVMKLNCYCGGLPLKTNNELKYNIVFSPDGLVNEYFNDCYVLKDGEIKSVKPFGHREVNPDLGTFYEAFNTSGGAPEFYLKHLQKLGVKHARYKTVRYIGHHSIINFLKYEAKLSNQEILDLIVKTCPPTTKDWVIVVVMAYTQSQKYGLAWSCKADESFTAMGQATSYPAIACAHIAFNQPSLKFVHGYEDIPSDLLVQTLRVFWPDFVVNKGE
jgi:saccharopine dehydrogenase-like NADP-dependent oxidoreductase